ncbi:MAG TPA: hypothetical protein VEL74_02895 [Thermoanaerobaculia bacterium]|nr:hypothetical protein [Thermoanaerobaculia bacterium]
MKKLALALVLCAGALATGGPLMAHHGGCHPNPRALCPDVYAPVTCSNGVTYSNSCRASAACATGCVGGV